jgi:hypothetical protein
MTRKSMDAEFRERVRALYDRAMAQIEPIIDHAISLARTTGRSADRVSSTEIRKILETAVAVYAAKCGPLETSTAAWLMLKAIKQTLRQDQECCDPDVVERFR